MLALGQGETLRARAKDREKNNRQSKKTSYCFVELNGSPTEKKGYEGAK